MAKLSYKASYYIFYVLVALCILVLGLFFGVGYTNQVGDYNAPEHTETLIYFMYFMMGVCIVVTLLGAFAQLAANFRDNPKGAMKSLLGFALFVVVLIVAYGMSSTEPLTMADGSVYSDAGMLKLTDAMIYSIYFLLTVAAVATLVNLSSIMKK